MPHPRLSPADAEKIAAYLLTLPNPAGGLVAHGHQLRHQPETLLSSISAQNNEGESVSTGKALFYDHGCSACHSIAHLGGQFAPSLDGISKHRDLKYIIDRITAAEFLTPNGPRDEYQERGAVMPPSNLSETELAA